MRYFITLLIISSFTLVHAQDNNREDVQESVDAYPIFAGIYPALTIPLADYKSNVTNVGLGGGIEFLVNLNQSPFYVGLASSISNYGNETLNFLDNGVELAWKTNTSFWDAHFVVQFEPPFKSNFQPYIMGKFGFNHLFTITRLVDTTSSSDDGTLQRDVDDQSWGLSYGGAVGALIPLDKNWLFMLNPRISYLKGSNVSYYAKQENFSLNGDTLGAFALSESTIDLLRIEVGILVYLRQ